MRSVSANAYSAMRVLDYKIVTNDGGTVYTTADIISMDIQRKLTDKGVSIGNAISDRLSVTLRKSENDIPKKTRFTVYVKFGNDSGYTMIGKFYVTKCTKSRHGYLNVTCMDYLDLLDKECKWKANSRVQALTFPATHQQMLDYIIARYSLTCNFVCQDWTQETKPEGYTYRQILGFIAASHAANVQIDEDGVVTFVQFLKDDTVTYPLSASNVISQTIDETAGYTVNGIYIEVDDNTDIYIDDVEGSEYDEDAVGIVKVKNPFASVAIAKYCWTQLGGMSYISTTITKRATTALQCGDVISVYDYAGEPAQLKAAITAIHYTVTATGGFQEQLTSYADTGENKKTTPNKKAEKQNSIPADFFSAADPANTASNKVKKDDEWYVRNNDTDKYLLEIKRRVLVSEATAESEAVYEWELVAVIPAGGSGVGENIGRHNERFNDYEDNTISETGNNDWNSLKGKQNTIGAGVVFACDIGGYNNTADGAAHTSLMRGQNNVQHSGIGDLIGGQGNTVDAGEGVTVGMNADVTGPRGVTFGLNCSNTRDDALCGGDYGFTGADFMIAIGHGGSASSPKNIFTVDKFGDVTAHAYNTSSADFAEYFEWADGNPEAADRMGLLVDQIGDKIAPAQGTEFFGAISARASVVGNAYEDYWHGKYLTDVFGRVQYDKKGRAIISPEFDPSREYVPRSQRPEWAVTGLTGCIIVVDDGSCKVGGYVSARQGIGTICYAVTPAKVLRRIDSTHIEILMK